MNECVQSNCCRLLVHHLPKTGHFTSSPFKSHNPFKISSLCRLQTGGLTSGWVHEIISSLWCHTRVQEYIQEQKNTLKLSHWCICSLSFWNTITVIFETLDTFNMTIRHCSFCLGSDVGLIPIIELTQDMKQFSFAERSVQ